MEKLETLHGVVFDGLTKFTDYTFCLLYTSYTVSLNNAEVEFKYTTSATIIPDPETVTDWDNERTFRVTSYNGEDVYKRQL